MKQKLVHFLISALVAFSAPLGAELLAYYPFDEDFNDASGNGNHLSLVEGSPAVTDTPGDFKVGGGALNTVTTVNNRSFLELANPLGFAPEDTWSIAFWARRAAGSDDRQGMVLGDTENVTDFIWLSNNPLQVQGLRFRSSDNMNANYDVGADDGEWHHWVLIADGAGNLTAYRDNVMLGSTATSTTFSVRNVAHGYNTNVHSMNGQIDELYLYNEAIGEAEVEALFLATPPEGLEITTLNYDSMGNMVTLTWTSLAGTSYAVKASRDLVNFDLGFGAAVMADEGGETTRTFDLSELGLENSGRLYFRIEKQ